MTASTTEVHLQSFALSLMELLAIRLSPQCVVVAASAALQPRPTPCGCAGKSLDMSKGRRMAARFHVEDESSIHSWFDKLTTNGLS